MSGLRPFALFRPSSMAEVGRLLGEHGDGASLYAGGTELLVLMKEGLVRPRALIDLKRVPGLGDIAARNGAVWIGATARHRDVERSAVLRELCPIVPRVARHVANVRVRTVGTVGGNLSFADPHSDLATLLMTLDAAVRLWSPGGERELSIAEFVRGAYETARADGEVLTGVRLTPPVPGAVAVYMKYAIYERPTLGVSVAVAPQGLGGPIADARIAVGCVGPRPERLPEVERLAQGLSPDQLLGRAGELADAAAERVTVAEDLYGSAEYKREMTRVFMRRALGVVAARGGGQEPHVSYPYTVVV